MTKEKCACGQTNNNRTCKYHFPITSGMDVSNKPPNKEHEKKYQIDSTKLDFSKNIMEQEAGTIVVSNKEEELDKDKCYPEYQGGMHRPNCEHVSPSDKTWGEEWWRTRIREVHAPRGLEVAIYGYKRLITEIEKIVEEELTSATIKAKERFIELIERNRVELRDKEDHLPNVYQYLKGKNDLRDELLANLEEPIK